MVTRMELVISCVSWTGDLGLSNPPSASQLSSTYVAMTRRYYVCLIVILSPQIYPGILNETAIRSPDVIHEHNSRCSTSSNAP
jgi:hypothetical protein